MKTDCEYDCAELGTHKDCDLHMDRIAVVDVVEDASSYYRDQITKLLDDLQACSVGRYATDVVDVESMKTYLKKILESAPKNDSI